MPRTVVITGASRGIGRELAQLYARAGDQVIAALRDPGDAPEGAARVVRLDVADPASIDAFAQALSGQRVDILVNSAGINGPHQGLDDMDYEAWRLALQVNAIAPFHVIAALLPNLEKAAQPKAVTLTSQMGSFEFANGGKYAYRSSKAAANRVMQTLAVDLKPKGVIVCPMHPGWVRTDMGGPTAAISVEESARGIATVIDRLALADSGRFWTWDGQEHPW